MPIGHIANGEGGASTRAKLNDVIDKANLVDDIDAAKAGYLDAPAMASGRQSRPGEPGRYFGRDNAGAPESLATFTTKSASPLGNVAVLNADATVAPKVPTRIEQSRQYRARYVFQREDNTGDPAGDAIRLGLLWMGATYNTLANNQVADLLDIRKSDGRVERVFDFPSETIPVPAGAVYVRPYVRTFGSSGVTHVEIIDIVDMTDSLEWSPSLDAVNAQLSSIEEELDTLQTNTAPFGGVGQLFDIVDFASSASGGASLRTDSLGRFVGWTIPSGSAGVNTSVRPRALLPVSLREGGVGQKVTVFASAATSAAYARAITPTIEFIDLSGATVTAATTVVRNEQVASGVRNIEMNAILPANVLFVTPKFVSSGTGNAVATEYFEIDNVEIRLESLTVKQSSAQANDAALRAFAVDEVKADATIAGFDEALAQGTYANGAVRRNDSQGRAMGWTIPIGSAGNTSNVLVKFDVPPKMRGRLAGRVVHVKVSCETSAGYSRTITPLMQAVDTGGNISELAVTSIRSWQYASTKRVVEYRVTVPADTIRLQPYLRQASLGNAVAEEYLLITDISMRIAETGSKISGPAAETADLMRATESLARSRDVNLGRMLDEATISVQPQNGAVGRYDDMDRLVGWTIPTGQTGTSTLLQTVIPLARRDRRALAGRRMRIEVLFAVSANYPKNTSPVGQSKLIDGTFRAPAITEIYRGMIGTDRFKLVCEFDIEGDEAAIQPYFQSTTGGAAASDLWVELIDLKAVLVDDDASHRDTLGWGLSLVRERAAQRVLELTEPNHVYPIMKTVASAGGDYTTLTAADTAILEASATERAQITIENGVYDVENFNPGAYRIFRGKDRERTIIRLLQPDDVDPADTVANSAINVDYSGTYRNLTFVAENARYAIHSDSNAQVKDQLFVLENCRAEHLGNQGAVDFQTGLGGSGNPSGVSVSTHAVAIGMSSGNRYRFTDCDFAGVRAAMSMHTNIGFTKPSALEFTRGRLVAQGADGYALELQPLGSGQIDTVLLTGSELVGDIHYEVGVWKPTTLDKQPANHTEIKLSGHGNSPSVFLMTDFGRALRIDDASTADGSGVSLSGSAVSVLFGEEVYSVDGAGGTAGYVYGWADVSGRGVGSASSVLITSLGQRLGDCSSVNKTLVVTPNGGSPITVTFNADHTAQSNATVLGIINAALGVNAVASLYDVGGRYRPFFTDEEKSLKNTSATTILMGMVVYLEDERSIRAMTATDDPRRFGGVAWEDIYPGQFGRVKTSGYLPISDILRTDAAAFVFGDTFSITSGQPGKISKGGSQGLLMAIRDDAVAVNRKAMQPYDATLASIALLGTASDKMLYTTGIDTWAEATITAFGRSLIDDANAAAAISTLGLDALYAQVAGPTADLGQNLGQASRRYGSGYFGSTFFLGGNIASLTHHLSLDGAAATVRRMTLRTGGLDRWYIQASNDAESGSNAGSNLQIMGRTDAGGALVTPISIARATGIVTFGSAPQLPTYTVATVPSASANTRGLIYVSDGTSNKRLAISDGTNWRWPDGTIVS